MITADLVGDFTLELRRVDKGELIIVRAARAKLSAKDKKITLQGMDEEGPVRAVFDYGECVVVGVRHSKKKMFCRSS